MSLLILRRDYWVTRIITLFSEATMSQTVMSVLSSVIGLFLTSKMWIMCSPDLLRQTQLTIHDLKHSTWGLEGGWSLSQLSEDERHRTHTHIRTYCQFRMTSSWSTSRAQRKGILHVCTRKLCALSHLQTQLSSPQINIALWSQSALACLCWCSAQWGGGGLTVRQVFCLKAKQVVKHCFRGLFMFDKFKYS